jgi:hypothetical protein
MIGCYPKRIGPPPRLGPGKLFYIDGMQCRRRQFLMLQLNIRSTLRGSTTLDTFKPYPPLMSKKHVLLETLAVVDLAQGEAAGVLQGLTTHAAGLYTASASRNSGSLHSIIIM